MESRTQRKRQNRHHLDKAREAVAQAQFMASLSQDDKKALLEFSKPKHKMLALMLFGAAMVSMLPSADAKPSAQASSKSKESPKTKTTQELTCQDPATCAPKHHLSVYVEPDVDPATCTYIQTSANGIISKLPDAKPMLKRVSAQAGFQAVCADKKVLDARHTDASYDAELNQLIYPSMAEAGVGGLAPLKERIYHHEFIHADTSRRHRTQHCSVTLFSKSQTKRIEKEMGLMGAKFDDTVVSSTPLPIWPPTKDNMDLFLDIIREDIKVGKVTDLANLHKKHFHKQPMTTEEQTRYQHYVDVLQGVLMYDEPRKLVLSPEQEQAYIQNPRSIPKEIDSRVYLGAVFKDIKVQTYPDGTKALVGMIKDPVSTFLYAVKTALTIFARPDMPDLVRHAEVDTHLRTGLPDAAFQLFFPHQWAHLQREEACCDRGEKDKCYKF